MMRASGRARTEQKKGCVSSPFSFGPIREIVHIPPCALIVARVRGCRLSVGSGAALRLPLGTDQGAGVAAGNGPSTTITTVRSLLAVVTNQIALSGRRTK